MVLTKVKTMKRLIEWEQLCLYFSTKTSMCSYRDKVDSESSKQEDNNDVKIKLVRKEDVFDNFYRHWLPDHKSWTTWFYNGHYRLSKNKCIHIHIYIYIYIYMTFIIFFKI